MMNITGFGSCGSSPAPTLTAARALHERLRDNWTAVRLVDRIPCGFTGIDVPVHGWEWTTVPPGLSGVKRSDVTP